MSLNQSCSSSALSIFNTSVKYRFWPVMEDSAYHSGDRVWRMPLWKYYSDQIQSKKELNLLIDRKDSIKNSRVN